MTVKTPFAYYGGKQRLAGWIADHLPPHACYVEPYAGGLSVLLAKPKATAEVVNDLDDLIVNFWQVLRDRHEDLIRACDLTPYSRTEFRRCVETMLEEGIDDLERARRWWVAVEQSMSHAPRRTGWAIALQGSRSHTRATTCKRHVTRMEAVASRLAEVAIECRPALEVIDRFDGAGTTFYVDPPYLGRKSKWEYRIEMNREDDHRELLDVLRDCQGAVVLSGYDNDLYGEVLGDWNRVEKAWSRGTGEQGGVKNSIEVLWINRDPPQQGSLLLQTTA